VSDFDPGRIGAFYDADTRRKGRDAGPRLGTVTEAGSVARHRDRLERAHVERIVPRRAGMRVLDLGGGAGRMTFALGDRVAEAVIVDMSAELLAAATIEARDRGLPLTTVHGSVSDGLPEALVGPGFDLILLFGVAGYLDEAGVDRLVEHVADALAPGGLVVMRAAVTTDGEARLDERFGPDGEPIYRYALRPRGFYARRFARRLRLTYRKPVCAHFFPWFLGGTEGAVQAARKSRGWLDRLSPLLVRIDPALQAAEDIVRDGPRSNGLLAPVPVTQDLLLFAPSSAPRDARRTDEPDGLTEPALSVVVIAFDEEDCIEPVIDELRAALDAEPGLRWELVSVDDGSTDATPAILDRLGALDGRIRVVHQPNKGIGGALRTGFDHARGSHVTWVPADGQIGPEAVLELYRRRDEAAMLTTVYRTRDDHWMRMVISNTLNTMIRVRTGEVARSGGNYLFAREAWLAHGPRDDDSMMISTAFRHALREAGLPPVEVEIDCRARVGGRSKVLNPRTIARTVAQLLRMR